MTNRNNHTVTVTTGSITETIPGIKFVCLERDGRFVVSALNGSGPRVLAGFSRIVIEPEEDAGVRSAAIAAATDPASVSSAGRSATDGPASDPDAASVPVPDDPVPSVADICVAPMAAAARILAEAIGIKP